MIEFAGDNFSPHQIKGGNANTAFNPRHPVLVLCWSFGLLLVMNFHQYLGAMLGALMSGGTFESVISGEAHSLPLRLGQGLVAALVGIPLVYLAVIFLWKRSADWMGLRFNFRFVIGGFALGVILPLVVLAVISTGADVTVITGPARLTLGESVTIMLSTLCWVSFTALSEETVFRGMVVREWASKWGWPVATLLGGLWFGAIHLLGIVRDLSLLSAIWVLIAGATATILFVALYVRARSLWLPIGFHAGWNLCLKGILGVRISGIEPGEALFQVQVSGDDWLTGGTFGIEASLVAMTVYLLTAAVVLRFGFFKNVTLLSPRPE